jgi:TPR repeat protein
MDNNKNDETISKPYYRALLYLTGWNGHNEDIKQAIYWFKRDDKEKSIDAEYSRNTLYIIYREGRIVKRGKQYFIFQI